MRSAHHATVVAALAAAALSLAGCGAVAQSASNNATPSAAAAGATAPATTATAAATATPAPASPSAEPSGAAAPSPTTSGAAGAGTAAPGSTDLATFTFPGDKVSFKYPSTWKVELFTGSSTPPVSGTATVYDADGNRQATIYSGHIADGVTHPVTRDVFETQPVPGLQKQPAPVAHYSFYADRMENNSVYRMHLTAGAPPSGADLAQDGIIRVGKDVLVAEVQFIEKPFASDAAAKAWLAGAEGQALKALLLSISYR
ncbi:hypothetical protein [Arthrobacter pascens]|uniref:hypothetical protein n=1 Tax=Arthrobacter pascens TaxID=1677 RepID=UPI00196A32A9|nr:hypothetical protein [Arthrobacter pascens]MBN3496462.1 hypothetical protein [Arthrobacter pascens]